MYVNILKEIDECKSYIELAERFVNALQEGKDKDVCMNHLVSHMHPTTKLSIDFCTSLAITIDKEME